MLIPLIVAASLMVPAAAPAEPKADTRTVEARTRFKAGSQLYKQARYREAIIEFEAAYQLKPHGVLHFNLAQCHEKLGDIPKALRAYRQYLREVPQADDRATVQAAMANLEKRLVEKGLQQLRIFSEPSDAEVLVDGRVQGRTPWSGELSLGKHRVQLTLAGREAIDREVELAADRSVDLEVQLAVAAPPPVVAAPPPPPVVAVAAPAEAVAKPVAETVQPAAPERPRVVTWVLVGVAAASLAAAAGCGIAAKGASDEMRTGVHDQAKVQELHDAAAGRQTAANVLYGVGAAAGVAGGVLFFAGRF